MIESVLDQTILTLQVVEAANLPLAATHVTARLVQSTKEGSGSGSGSAAASAVAIQGTARKDTVGNRKKSENPTFTTSFSWGVNVEWIEYARLEVVVHSGKKMIGTLNVRRRSTWVCSTRGSRVCFLILTYAQY